MSISEQTAEKQALREIIARAIGRANLGLAGELSDCWEIFSPSTRRMLLDAAGHACAALAEAGYVIVPRESPPAMIEAARPQAKVYKMARIP